MTEILTESFCERCGTRYTFESAAPRRSRIGRVRVVSKGLRNFVMSGREQLLRGDGRRPQRGGAERDRAPARRVPQDLQLLPHLPPVHVRQLLEPAEGRCLTCSPIPGMERFRSSRARIAAAPDATRAASSMPRRAIAAAVGPEAWPEADLAVRPGRRPSLGRCPAGRVQCDLDDAARPAMEPSRPDVAARPHEAVAARAGTPRPTGPRRWLPGRASRTPSPHTRPRSPPKRTRRLEAEAATGYEDLDAGVLSRDWTEDEPMPGGRRVCRRGESPTVDREPEPEPGRSRAESAAEPESPTWPRPSRVRPGRGRAGARAGRLPRRSRSPSRSPWRPSRSPSRSRAVAPSPSLAGAGAGAGAVAAEPEPEPVAAEPEPEPEPVAAEPEPEPSRRGRARAGAGAVAAEPEPEPEPSSAAPEPEPEPEPVARRAGAGA